MKQATVDSGRINHEAQFLYCVKILIIFRFFKATPGSANSTPETLCSPKLGVDLCCKSIGCSSHDKVYYNCSDILKRDGIVCFT